MGECHKMLKQKITTTFLVFLILLISLFPTISSQEIATQEDISIAGVTPDFPFWWGLDRAIEGITEMFSEKAKLNHAKERLAEVKVMIQENKIEEAEKARQSFNRLRLRVRNQTQIQEHTELMNNLGQKISAIASVKGKLTEEQRNEIKDLIFQHKERIKEESDDMEEDEEDEDFICCKIYGFGVGMEQVNIHYELMEEDDCSVPEDFVGGGREIVNNSYCE